MAPNSPCERGVGVRPVLADRFPSTDWSYLDWQHLRLLDHVLQESENQRGPPSSRLTDNHQAFAKPAHNLRLSRLRPGWKGPPRAVLLLLHAAQEGGPFSNSCSCSHIWQARQAAILAACSAAARSRTAQTGGFSLFVTISTQGQWI